MEKIKVIENTNRMAESVEPFELDISFKYPILYGERDREVLHQVLDDNLQAKIKEGAITPEQVEPFKAAIAEECRVFDKIEMSGFMLFMSELVTWCKSHGIPIGFNRGSCGGSRVAYVTNGRSYPTVGWGRNDGLKPRDHPVQSGYHYGNLSPPHPTEAGERMYKVPKR